QTLQPLRGRRRRRRRLDRAPRLLRQPPGPPSVTAHVRTHSPPPQGRPVRRRLPGVRQPRDGRSRGLGSPRPAPGAWRGRRRREELPQRASRGRGSAAAPPAGNRRAAGTAVGGARLWLLGDATLAGIREASGAGGWGRAGATSPVAPLPTNRRRR